MKVETFLKFFLDTVLRVSSGSVRVRVERRLVERFPSLQRGTSLAETAIRYSRDVVINSHERAIGPPDLSSGIPEPFESLWRGNFVDEMSVDVEEGVAGSRVDDVVIEDFVVQRTGGAGRCWHVGELELGVW
jgi:hypothetical protein